MRAWCVWVSQPLRAASWVGQMRIASAGTSDELMFSWCMGGRMALRCVRESQGQWRTMLHVPQVQAWCPKLTRTSIHSATTNTHITPITIQPTHSPQSTLFFVELDPRLDPLSIRNCKRRVYFV